jgi:AhpD family alkylhydroperoxidase
MTQRMNVAKFEPAAFHALLALEKAVAQSGLDETTRHLVKVKASMINGCGYCIDLHSKEAREHGETEQRLYALNAWREVQAFSDKERAALGLTDAITRLGEHGVPDDVWDEGVKQWGQEGVAKIVFVAATINLWNRIGVATRLIPESFKKKP